MYQHVCLSKFGRYLFLELDFLVILLLELNFRFKEEFLFLFKLNLISSFEVRVEQYIINKPV